MRAIILAAGRGTRLAPVGWHKPKCLLEFGGRTLLDFIADSLVAYGINEVTIVLGYQREMVERRMRSHTMNWEIVFNEDYANTNTVYSLWLARHSIDGDFIYVNGDVLFDRRIIQLLLAHRYSAMAIQAKPCGPEEVKVVVDANDRITQIGKQLLPGNCLGEFIGLAKFSRNVCAPLVATLEHYNQAQGRRDLFFEVAVNDILPEQPIMAARIGDLKAIEIDCPADYEAAGRLWVSGAVGSVAPATPKTSATCE